MNEPPTVILLIRHGLNDYVQAGRLAGRTPGVQLNAAGRAQAAALAERLAPTALAALYSSPLERARETAGPLADRRGLAVRILDDIIESDIGAWTCQAIADLSQDEQWRQVQTCPSTFRFPGGESFTAIQVRMVAAVEMICVTHPGQAVALVSHADPIKLAVAHFIGMPLDYFQRLDVAPTSITELAFTTHRIPHLRRLNDCAHVPALPPVAPDTTES